jgi:hypothetical protein
VVLLVVVCAFSGGAGVAEGRARGVLEIVLRTLCALGVVSTHGVLALLAVCACDGPRCLGVSRVIYEAEATSRAGKTFGLRRSCGVPSVGALVAGLTT